jgi:hypothetical protein
VARRFNASNAPDAILFDLPAPHSGKRQQEKL